MYLEFIDEIKNGYVEMMLSRREKAQRLKAEQHVEEIEGILKGQERAAKLEELAKAYSSETTRPSLLGFRRFVQLRGMEE